VSPVVGAREAVIEFDETLAGEPLIFPDEAILSNAHIVRSFTEEEEAEVNEAMATAIGV
jgi:spermidine/putrescine transport system substrate-binding protein